jgi:hypothetical protein
MIKRKIKEKILHSLKTFPVVGILGSRQVGKTTLAKEIQTKCKTRSLYLDLELPSDLNKLQDPELFLSQYSDTLVIVDEIQRMPGLFPIIRALVDQNRVPGRFLIIGSSSPDLIRQASESLAGRIIYHELAPFYLEEIGYDEATVRSLWLKGGYPDSYLAGSDDLSFSWREAFIQTYLERDLPQLGIRIPSLQLRRFWTMLSHSHGQLWNASQVAKSLGVTAPTVKRYLDILTETFVVRQLQPFHSNIKKRLIKSPKIYIRDSGLLHSLLKNKTWDALHGHPMSGHSWEGFVIEQVINTLPENGEKYFYRTNAGAEIDLIVFIENRPVAIEVKYSSTPKVSKGFWSAYEDMECKKGFVVYPGKDFYPIGKNVFALPVSEIGRVYSQIL